MDFFSLWGGGVGLPETVALAAVAVIGYVFGRRRDDGAGAAAKPEELVRATEVARQLEAVAASLRNDLAAHRAEVERFKHNLRAAGEDGSGASRTLQDEAERILEPTLRLVGQVATAYDQIRRQSRALADFSGGRTDELTGLCNRRALSELLGIELSSHEATGGSFSIAVLGLEAPEGGSRAIRQERILLATELLRPQLRETDLLARYGLDEFVVVMPNTRLFGASRFGRRIRQALGEAGLTVSCGLTQSQPDDSASTLLGRADSALYSAKATAAGEQFLHNGSAIRNDAAPPSAVADEPPQAATA